MSVILRARAWLGELAVARTSRPSRSRRANKALVLWGLIAGLMLGGVSTADAQVWDFSYSGSGVSASGTFTSVLNVGGWYDITSVTGSRTEGSVTLPITGLYTVTTSTYEKYHPNFIDLWFATSANFFEWSGYVNGGPPSFDQTLSGNYNFAMVDGTVTPHVDEVPEINASAGLEALAVLFVFGLIMREMFLRRRFAA